MRRSEGRILTTHTGSLPRPKALTELFARRTYGEAVDEAAITREGQAATRAILPRQVEAGLDVINNGEQERDSFALYIRHRLTGIGGKSQRAGFGDLDNYPDYKQAFADANVEKVAVSNTAHLPAAIGAVGYPDTTAIDAELADFAAALAPLSGRYVESFMSAPSPGIVGSIVQNRHYETEDAYFAALGAALRVEYEAIHRAGHVVQLDCPDLALERHVSYRDRSLSDFLGFVERIVGTINDAIADIPRERMRLHVCWGNYEGPHDLDVPLADIWPIIKTARVGGFVLPFANPRHAHEMAVIADSPMEDDQILVAGVIDTLTNFVEHPEVVADRLERAAVAVGDPTRVLAGTDCGFDTAAGRGRVTADVVWAKMRSMAEGARIASTRLFGG